MGDHGNAENLVETIFATDRRIRFCAVVDSSGNLEAGGMRPGFKFLEPKSETQKIVMRMFLNMAIDKATDPYLGSVSWAMVRRKKLLHITFPLAEGRQVQITATIAFPLSNMTKLGKLVAKLGKKT